MRQTMDVVRRIATRLRAHTSFPRTFLAGMGALLLAGFVPFIWMDDDSVGQTLGDALVSEPAAEGVMLDDFAVMGRQAQFLDVTAFGRRTGQAQAGKQRASSTSLSLPMRSAESSASGQAGGLRIHIGGVGEALGEVLVGSLTLDATEQVAGSIRDVRPLAAKMQSSGESESIEQTMVTGSAVSEAASDDHSAVSEEAGESSTQIAVNAMDSTDKVLDFVRALPAPAAGINEERGEMPASQVTVQQLPVGDGMSPNNAVDPNTDVIQAVGDIVNNMVEEPQHAKHNIVAVSSLIADGQERTAGAAMPVTPQENEIDKFLGLADVAMSNNRLLLPEKNSAHHYYRRVLAVDGTNAAARAGLTRIVQQYETLARRALDRQDYDKAELYIARALRVDPANSRMLSLRDEVADTIAAAEAAELAAAELARLAMMAVVEEPPAPVVESEPVVPSNFESLMQVVDGY